MRLTTGAGDHGDVERLIHRGPGSPTLTPMYVRDVLGYAMWHAEGAPETRKFQTEAKGPFRTFDADHEGPFSRWQVLGLKQFSVLADGYLHLLPEEESAV